ncbi:hypothetical protein NA256_16115 [Salmonella sp. NW805]|uniref:hypothetical protein n=1 Tax=unclassified Salmonella TaxID=2614656 RepID=UPI001A198BBE|nr:hypothetical protein [Salmonella enterica subsp. diarizonae]HBM0245184.1 hypothetical protein [Salmonella enterica]HBM0504449.1 hypothetical protein [Salmonella enterica]
MSDVKRYEITWKELTFNPVIRVDVDFAKFNTEEAVRILEMAGIIKNECLIIINDIEGLAKQLMQALAWGLFCNLFEKAKNTKDANTLLRRARLRGSDNSPGKFEYIGIHFVSISNWEMGYQSSVIVTECEG